MARIRISDLPVVTELQQEELECIFGAGPRRARLGVERLEDRQLLSASYLIDDSHTLWRQDDATGVRTWVDGQAREFALDPGHNALFVLETNDSLWRQDTNTAAWTWVDGQAREMALDPAHNALFVLETNHTLWRQDTNTAAWTSVDGQARGMALDPGHNALFVLETNNSVWRQDTNTAAWTWVDGQAREMALDQAHNALFVLETNASLWRQDTATAAWSWVDGQAREMALDQDHGALFVLETNASLWRQNTATAAWTSVDTQARDMALDRDHSALFVLETNASLWRQNTATGAWTWVDGQAQDMALDRDHGALFVLETNASLWRQNTATAAWDPAPLDTQARGMALDRDHAGLFVLETNASLWRLNTATKVWDAGPLDGQARDMALDPDHAGLFVLETNASLWRLNTATKVWDAGPLDSQARDMALDRDHAGLFVLETNNTVWRRNTATAAWDPAPLDAQARAMALDPDHAGLFVLETNASLWRLNTATKIWDAGPLDSQAREMALDPDHGGLFVLETNASLWRLNTTTKVWDAGPLDAQARDMALDRDHDALFVLETNNTLWRQNTATKAWDLVNQLVDSMSWSDGNLQVTYTPIGARWQALGGAGGFLGIPTAYEVLATGGVGRVVHFQGGDIYWAGQTGAHEVHGLFRDEYNSLGGSGSFLGLPTSDLNDVGQGFQWQNFQGGVIYYSTAFGAHAILGNPADPTTFWGRFAAAGYERGLGLPTGEVNAGNGFQWQNFQAGVIYYSAATGAHTILGNPSDPTTFWGRFAAAGYEHGLGQPTGEVNAGDGFQWQNFQAGVIYYSAATGAHVIPGNPTDPTTFWGRFAAAGYERGLGLPTGEVNPGNGFQWQNFHDGYIYGSAATGADAILAHGGVAGADGSSWFLGAAAVDGAGDHAIYRIGNGQVTQMPGSAVSLAAAEGTIWALNSGNQICRWDGSSWIQQASVVAADGSIWFLGTASVDSAGDHAIYRISNGQVMQMPGAATQLLVIGGTVSALTLQSSQLYNYGVGGSPTLALSDVTGLIPLGNGAAVHVDIGPYLQADLSEQYSPASGSWSFTFATVRLNADAFFAGYLDPALRDLDAATQEFDTIAKYLSTPLPLISNFKSDATIAWLVDAVTGIVGLDQYAQAITTINNTGSNLQASGWIGLGNFTTNVSSGGAANITAAQGADFFAQVGAVGDTLKQLENVGVHFTLLDDTTNFFQVIVGQNPSLFTITLPQLGYSFDTKELLLATVPVGWGLSVDVKAIVDGTVTGGGTIGCDTAGLLTRTFQASFYAQNVSLCLDVGVGLGGYVGVHNVLAVGVSGEVHVKYTSSLDVHGQVYNPQDIVNAFSGAGSVYGQLYFDIDHFDLWEGHKITHVYATPEQIFLTF